MKRMLIVMLIAFASLLYGCTETQNNYVNRDYNFSVIYPKDWRISSESRRQVIFLSPKEAVLVPECQVMVTELPANWGASEYVNDMEKYLKDAVKTYGHVSKTNITINGTQAYEWNYTFTNVNWVVLKFHNVVIVKNGIAYHIECMTTQDLFEDYSPQFESFITSFKFTD